MEPDKYQQAWQSDAAQMRVTFNSDLLLKQVQRNQLDFLATILRRDLIEVVVGLLLLPYWFYQGITSSLPWTWYLTVPAIVWMVGFFLVDRVRHPQTPSNPSESLLKCVKNSLTQVDHQIWLLRNVFWWYLLPFTISIQTFFAHGAWLSSGNWLEALGFATPFFIFLVVIYAFLDFLNQRAIRVNLGPRRQELLTLLASLAEDDTMAEFATMSSVQAVQRSSVPGRWLIVTALSFVTFVVFVLAAGTKESGYDEPTQSTGPADDSLTALVAWHREQNKLVGLAAMVMVDGKVIDSAVDGERMIRSGVPLQIGDQWHLGGITCSITATMIAGLVESGQMRWTDTIGEVFPDAALDEYWKPITLKQLLTNTAGAPISFSAEIRKKHPPFGEENAKARREAVLEMISTNPHPAGGANFISAVGPAIAGAMAEKVTSDTWSNLVTGIVFQPLKLTGAGFGPPKSSDALLEQPRGHQTLSGNYATKYAVSDQSDNTPIMGPALGVHMTLNDLCTYATEHLRGYFAEGKLLSGATYKVLHTPELNQYACGWVRRKPDTEIPHTVYWHNGSNTMWYALIAFIPEKNMVVAVTSNDGDIAMAEAAAWEIVKAAVLPDNVTAERPDGDDYLKKSPFDGVRWQGSQPEVQLGEE